ncbi:hypothetical protein NVIRENTERO_02261 [Sodalis praecaptivus]|nr:hypothetical protein NVIRENTERO_02261 [Sodalis praecaptivus]
MSWHTQNTRLDTELTLSGQERLDTGFFALGGDAADDIGGGFCFGLALRDTHDHSDRFSLGGDSIQRAGQRAFSAGFAAGVQHVGQQYRRIERKGFGVGIIRRAHHAHNRGADRGNGAGAFVDFLHAHAVVIVLWHKAISCWR